MTRLIDDENLSDAERIAAIQEATGAGPARAEQMLEQSRGAPLSDRIVVGSEIAFSATSSTSEVTVLRVSGTLEVFAVSAPEGELVHG
jgi:hypothetical protein